VQCGERGTGIERAWQHGLAAVAELGLTARLRPVPAEDPGSWSCVLHRDGRPVEHGAGSGKGAEEVAGVGAVFEALEHHLGLGDGLPPAEHVRALPAHRVADRGDAALGLLAEGPDRPVGCLPYLNLHESTVHHDGLRGGTVRDIPIFLSTPGYLDPRHAGARAALGDTYDYSAARRYALNSGWAAGASTDEALVHAINEIVERDAMSLLLISRFLARTPAPLRVVDPATLPPALAALHHRASSRTGLPVRLLEMTTDLGVPAYWAHVPAPAGVPARVRGCGASLSAHYAAERALTELIQIHSITTTEPSAPAPAACTTRYPALHRCHLADFSDPDPVRVPFTDTTAPATPREHLAVLLDRLHARGFTAWAWPRHITEHLAVLNVCIPGTERFVLVTDGQLVLPGPRGRTTRTTPTPSP
jgi:ribosomal protein S12 methylthiotransferase accessory factor